MNKVLGIVLIFAAAWFLVRLQAGGDASSSDSSVDVQDTADGKNSNRDVHCAGEGNEEHKEKDL